MLNMPVYRRRGTTAREWSASTSELRSPCYTIECYACTAIRKPERCLWRYVPNHLFKLCILGPPPAEDRQSPGAHLALPTTQIQYSSRPVSSLGLNSARVRRAPMEQEGVTSQLSIYRHSSTYKLLDM